MKCTNCGADISDNGKCEYCGTIYFEEPIPPTKKEIAKEYTKRGWKFLTTPTKIALMLWAICCIFNITSIKDDGIAEYIGVSLFGFLFFVVIVQIISSKKQRQKLHQNHNSQSTYAKNTKVSFDKPYDKMDGHEFEYFCGDILGKSGFTEIEVTKGSGDQGIDIIAFKDGVKYGIQCKCYSSNIGNKAVQEAFAGKTFYNCHVAAVLTNQYFTKSAQELAAKNGVLLWDRDRLNQFINSHK